MISQDILNFQMYRLTFEKLTAFTGFNTNSEFPFHEFSYESYLNRNLYFYLGSGEHFKYLVNLNRYEIYKDTS